jgi:integrase/recombinase XerD
MKKNGRRTPRKIPEVLSPEEQRRFLEQLQPTDTLIKLRNYAVLRLMLNTGLRISEMIGLQLKDVDWRSGSLKVRGKGDKERMLWLSAGDRQLLQDWLAHRPGKPQPQDPLFTDLDGRKPVCERWFRDLIYRVAREAGIVKRISPHTLRHTFATDLLRSTKNLFLVSKALGHANLTTTQIYLHLVDGEMEDALKNLRNGG